MADPDEPKVVEHPDDPNGTHRTHCCKIHRCKYGADECPVARGLVIQAYLCEQCTYDSFYSERPYTGLPMATLRIELAKAPDNPAEGLGWLPTSEEVTRALAEHLTGLDLGAGWTIAAVIDD